MSINNALMTAERKPVCKPTSGGTVGCPRSADGIDKGNESATVTQVGAHYKEAQALVTRTSALKSPRRAYNIKLGIDRIPALCQFR